MPLNAVLAQVLDLLQRQGWASFRTLRRRFGLGEVALTALTQALLDTQPVTVDEAGTRLVWQGELRPAAASPRTWDVVPSAPAMAGAAPWPLAGERSRGLLPLVGREQEVELLRARWAQVQMGQGQGKRTEARQLLAPIYGWFTEGFDTADLQEAKELLAALA
jgi:hypothetical protein